MVEDEKASRPSTHRTDSSGKHPTLGMPDDPAAEIDEAVKEIRQEIELRQRKGSTIKMPRGADLKKAVEDKLGKKL